MTAAATAPRKTTLKTALKSTPKAPSRRTATAARKLALVRLLGIAKEMAQNSDAPEARGFDSARWLGHWIERPQPALGGRKPAEMMDTPTGLEAVCKALGAIGSGVYL